MTDTKPVNPDAGVLNQMAPAAPKKPEVKPEAKPLEFKFEKVEGSSQIDSLAHAGNQMRVKFHSGDVYEYGNITPELYNTIRSGGTKGSVGKTFNDLVKSEPRLHPYAKI